MDRATLTTFVDYNNWANLRLLERAAHIDATALQSPSPFFDLGTAFKTLLHLVDVEWSWLRGARGLDMSGYLWDVEPLPDLAAIHDFALRFGPELHAYCESLTKADLSQHVDVGTPSGRNPEWERRIDILIHLISHGTIHRTELAHFLTSQGHSPGDLDYLDYVGTIKQPPSPDILGRQS